MFFGSEQALSCSIMDRHRALTFRAFSRPILRAFKLVTPTILDLPVIGGRREMPGKVH
jgi:hypothetical protein